MSEQDALADVAGLCGYDSKADLIREVLRVAVLERDHGKLMRLVRRIDKRVGVQLDLALMATPGAAVVPQKRVKRARKARARKGARVL